MVRVTLMNGGWEGGGTYFFFLFFIYGLIFLFSPLYELYDQCQLVCENDIFYSDRYHQVTSCLG